jgi:hypothetical protein
MENHRETSGDVPEPQRDRGAAHRSPDVAVVEAGGSDASEVVAVAVCIAPWVCFLYAIAVL